MLKSCQSLHVKQYIIDEHVKSLITSSEVICARLTQHLVTDNACSALINSFKDAGLRHVSQSSAPLMRTVY